MIRGAAAVLSALLAVALSTLGFLALLEKLDPEPRAYCLDADGQKGTVYVSGPSAAIITLDAPSAGRYVISEGECAP